MSFKHLATLLSLVLIACGVYLGAAIFYQVAAPKRDQAPPESPSLAPPKPAEKARPKPPLSRYRAIAERNLFRIDTGGQPSAAPAIDIEALKQTELKLKLWGTVSSQGQEAYAVIEDSQSRRQNLYRVGDAIQSATLKMILREKVVLQVEDRDEILQMEEVPGGRGPAPRQMPEAMDGGEPAAGQMPEAMDGGGPDLQAEAPLPVDPPAPRPQTIRLRPAMLQGMLSQGEDPLKDLTLQPHQTDGAPDGVALTGIQPRSILRRLGLRDGDVITAIDGEPIRSAEHLTVIFEKLNSGSGLSLELNRRGRPTTLDFQVE
ncbi:MAG: type II secretion system protein GspC [Desulfobacterales bacterium]